MLGIQITTLSNVGEGVIDSSRIPESIDEFEDLKKGIFNEWKNEKEEELTDSL